MGDLAGVRIGLHFPSDIPKVVKAIRKHFDEGHDFGTVTHGGRHATQGRNRETSQHGIRRYYTTSADGAVDYWKHSGYESWQLVVEWKSETQTERVRLRGLSPYTYRVEIQIGTVVTQVWAEVQHDILYKTPLNILVTPNMKRVIDAINNLAITPEIMLNELEGSLEEAKKDAVARGERLLLLLLAKSSQTGSNQHT